MMAFEYCDASLKPTNSITSPTDLTLPFSPQYGQTEVLAGTNGRPGPNAEVPVLTVYHQFLLPSAARHLKRFNKAVQIRIAKEASAALIARTQTPSPSSEWLKQYSSVRADTDTTSLFGFTDIKDKFSRPGRRRCPPERPFLLICLTAPPSGILFHSPGYPDSAVRLVPGDAILCQLSGDEKVTFPESGRAHCLRLFGDPDYKKSILGLGTLPRPITKTVIPSSDPIIPPQQPKLHPENSAKQPRPSKSARKAEKKVRAQLALRYASIIGKYEARIARLEAGLEEERARAGEDGISRQAAGAEGRAISGAAEERENRGARSVKVKQEQERQGDEVMVKDVEGAGDGAGEVKVKAEKRRKGKGAFAAAASGSVNGKEEPPVGTHIIDKSMSTRGQSSRDHTTQDADTSKAKAKRKSDISIADISTGGKRRKA